MRLNPKLKTPPGTIVYTGNKSKSTEIFHIQYSKDSLIVHENIKPYSTDQVDWISIEGLKDIEKIKELCLNLNVDSLIIEDIFNTNQRNKFEIYEDYIFFVIKFSYLTENKTIEYDYISILLFNDKILTFSEQNNRFKEEIISRLKNKELQISNLEEDYLFYAIYDMIIDEEINVFHYLDYELEKLEEEIFNLSKHHQVILYDLRKHLLFLKNQNFDNLEYISPKKLLKNPLFNNYLKKYIDDLEDHMINLKDKSNFALDSVRNLYDVYSNLMSNKANEIMKTLTIFSAIFIPLSFIAGIFGMNFINFPILLNQSGLLIFSIICILIPVTMLIYFKIKKWF